MTALSIAAALLMLAVLPPSVVAHPARSLRAATTTVNCTQHSPPIISFHVHVVYALSKEQIQAADDLRAIARGYFAPFLGPDCVDIFDQGQLCMITDHLTNETDPGSPFPAGEWSLFVPVDYYAMTVQWFTTHYLTTHPEFSLLVHTNTGCEYEDHSLWALWAGQAYPLDLSIFTKQTQTSEFNNTRGDAQNPVCAAAGATCGTAAMGGQQIICCSGSCSCANSPCTCSA